MLIRIFLIIFISLSELFCGCTYVNNMEGSDRFHYRFKDLIDWSAQITMNVLMLKQAILTGDSITFTNFFEKDVLLQNNINFKEDITPEDYNDVKIHISNIEIAFFTNKKRFANLKLHSDSLFDDLEAVKTISKKLKEDKEDKWDLSLFPIDAGNIVETTIVYAKVDLGFALKANKTEVGRNMNKASGKQTFYLKKNNNGNWKIINFFVDSPGKNKIFNL